MGKIENRVYKYDNIKFILILSVVIGHFFNNYVSTSNIIKTLTFIIYTFHMPAFIFLSGLFSDRQKKINDNKLLGYIILGILIITIKVILNRQTEIELLGGNGWFLFVLSGFMLITYLFRNISDLNFIVIFGLLALISGYDSSLSTLTMRFLTFMPFYMLGLYLKPEKLLNIIESKKIKILSIITLVIYCIAAYLLLDKIYVLRSLFLGKYNYFNAFEHCNFLFRIVTYLLSTVIMFAIFSIIPNKKMKLMTYAGSKTLAIYFYHIPVYMVFNKIGIFEYLQSTLNTNLAIIIYGILAFVLTHILANKYLSKPIDALLNNKNVKGDLV